MKFNFKDGRIWIDLINMGIGIAIIVLALIALQNEAMEKTLFNVVFALGTVMFLLNSCRSIKTNRILSVIFLLFAGMSGYAFFLSVHGL